MAMPGSIYALMPWIAVGGFVLFTIAQLLRAADDAHRSPHSRLWLFPALLSLLFAGWSVHAVLSGGPIGFWAEHVRNAWGNQIWFDLLLAIGIGWALILPRARAVGMRPWPWLIFILCTGCIGLSAMLARLLWLEDRRLAADPTFKTKL